VYNDHNLNSKAKGERSEAAVLACLLKAGKIILLPFGDNQRYDLVIDEGTGEFTRVQVKTAKLDSDKQILKFKTRSSQAHRGRGQSDYKGQCELFAIYSPELDRVYVVPVDEVGRQECVLRLDAPKNGQLKGIRFAKDYLFS